MNNELMARCERLAKCAEWLDRYEKLVGFPRDWSTPLGSQGSTKWAEDIRALIIPPPVEATHNRKELIARYRRVAFFLNDLELGPLCFYSGTLFKTGKENRQIAADIRALIIPPPAEATGGMQCESCGAIFIGEPFHLLCAICEKAFAAVVAEAVEATAMADTQRFDTGITDVNGKKLLEGNRVRVSWLAELGITELDCEAVGIVAYMADDFSAAWFVKFDDKFRRVIQLSPGGSYSDDTGTYEVEYLQLVQAGSDDDLTIHFEKIEATEDQPK